MKRDNKTYSFKEIRKQILEYLRYSRKMLDQQILYGDYPNHYQRMMLHRGKDRRRNGR